MTRFVTAGALVCTLVLLGISGPASSGGESGVTFDKPVQVSADDNQSAAEPSIRSSPDGNLYIVAPTGLGGVRTEEGGQGGDLIWRSEDQGKTWTYLGSYDQLVGGGDADIASDMKGDLWGSGLTLANTTATFSADNGETWCVNPIGALSTLDDRQWIETYKDEPFAFMTTGQIAQRSIILSRLELASAPPEDPTAGCPVVSNTVVVSEDDSYQWPGEVAVDPADDYVYVTYNTDEEKFRHDKIVVTRSDLTLTENKRFVVTTTTGDSFDSFTVVDVDAAGNVYALWNERRPEGPKGRRGKTHTYVSVSKNHGQAWSTPVKVNDYPQTTVFPWLVAGDKGRVAIAYYGIRHTGPSPEEVVLPGRRLPAWKVFVSYSLNATAANPKYTEVQAVPKWIHKGNVCTSGTGCASGTRDLLDFFQVDLDACGRIVITYTDNSRDVVTQDGVRTTNEPEYIYFVGQKDGPRFYTEPINSDVC
ncbi:MAG: hypothetical protein ACRDJI_08610 [Actinomycetota bacterium]